MTTFDKKMARFGHEVQNIHNLRIRLQEAVDNNAELSSIIR